jgi:putative transposase
MLRELSRSLSESASRSVDRPRMAEAKHLLEYHDRFEVRFVSANGGIRWQHDWVNVSALCAGDYVGLEEIDHGVWNVYFGPLKLGRFLERHRRIEDAYGRLLRSH